MDIYDVREKLMKRSELFSELKGEWNDGYFASINFAVSLVNDYIRLLESVEENKYNVKKHHYEMHPSKEIEPSYEKKCGGENCPCKSKA